jgi:hypothetical protein
MADETSRRYLFVAIDRATRWVFVRVYNSKTAANARRFLRDLERACSLRIRTILAPFRDIAAQYPVGQWTTEKSLLTVCLVCVNGRKAGSMSSPRSPQTNGPPLGDCGQSPAGQRVERFNGRIEDVPQSHHFQSGEELEATLHRYVWLYNQQLPQSALGSKAPLQAMKDWHTLKPELFKKQPYYRPGCDN